MARSIHVLAFSVALTCLPFTSPTASAQGKLAAKKGAEPITGTVVSIEKEKTGKNYMMKIKNSDDDEEINVPLLPRTQLAVTAKGDEGFLKASVYVQTKVAASGNGMDLFAKDFTVYLGNVTPSAYMKPDPADKTVFDIGGKIIDTNNSGMLVQCGPQPKKVSFEDEKNVTVKIADASYIKEGDEVEVEGTMIKSKKQLNAKVVTVKSTTDISSADYFAALEDSKRPKSKTKTSAKTKPEGDAAGSDKVDDPFGLKNKGKGKDAKAEKSEGADSKKDPAKKADGKKEETKEEE